MALRTMAAKLKQKIPAAVQRVLASSRAPATSGSPSAGLDRLDRLDPEIRRVVEEFVNIDRKNRRNEALAGLGLAAVTLSLGIRRVSS